MRFSQRVEHPQLVSLTRGRGRRRALHKIEASFLFANLWVR
jgi:hypothetical protein